MEPKSKSKDRFRQGRDRGCRFLMRQLRPDGGFGARLNAGWRTTTRSRWP